MNRHDGSRPRPSHPWTRLPLAGLALALVALALSEAPARAQCNFTSLPPDSPLSSPDAVSLSTFQTPAAAWGAIGIRSAAGSEHGLGVFAQTAASPTCVQGPLGSSALTGGVDFVIGDFRRNGKGPWYGQVTRSSGSGPVLTEAYPAAQELVVDDVPTVATTANQVIQVYQVFLEAGVSYILAFTPPAGVDAKLLLFKNPGPGVFWAGRSSRLLETSGQTSYPATTSDEYALVVVNDNGGAGMYSLAVEQCQPPVSLDSGTPISTGAPLRYVIPQVSPYWSACGVRGAGTDDWDILAYATGHGRLEPECFQDTLFASQHRGGGVDLVTGDFNTNPTATYYTRVIQVSGTQPGVVEWDDGPDEVIVGAPPLSRTLTAANVIEIWDVNMVAGTPYSIFFQRAGGADTHFLVFENPGQQASLPYWTGRNGAVLSGVASADYVPAFTGYHGIAVVNDNGFTGSYQLAVYGANTGVGTVAAGPVGIEAVRPNPVLGRASITYRVGKPGRVAFDVLDVSGREVSRIAELDGAAGEGAVTFDPRAGGRRLPSGIYFVRMSTGGAAVSYRKFLLLP